MSLSLSRCSAALSAKTKSVGAQGRARGGLHLRGSGLRGSDQSQQGRGGQGGGCYFLLGIICNIFFLASVGLKRLSLPTSWRPTRSWTPHCSPRLALGFNSCHGYCRGPTIGSVSSLGQFVTFLVLFIVRRFSSSLFSGLTLQGAVYCCQSLSSQATAMQQGISSCRTPLDCFLANFKYFKREGKDYGFTVTLSDLGKSCQLEWPTFGVGWPQKGTLDLITAQGG